MKTNECTDCGRSARPGGHQCSRCYQRRYRATASGKRHHNDAVIRYVARNPEKHRVWSETWKRRVGLSVPDLRAAYAAVKRLERALAEAARHP